MDKPEYYFVQTLCRDGGHEYTDSFCVVEDYELNDEQFEQAVLDWNFGGVEWDDSYGDWSDGERALSIRTVEAITKEEHDVMKKYIYSFPISIILKDVIGNAIQLGIWKKNEKEKSGRGL